MIFRISTGRAGSPEDADRYATFLDTTVLPELRTLPGHRGACLLRRELDLLIVTRWESLDAIRAFAGEDIERAVFEPEAQRLLPSRDEQVKHYELVLDRPHDR